ADVILVFVDMRFSGFEVGAPTLGTLINSLPPRCELQSMRKFFAARFHPKQDAGVSACVFRSRGGRNHVQ
ncbi:hypothetical protein, partial [Burkholderia sp. 3C]